MDVAQLRVAISVARLLASHERNRAGLECIAPLGSCRRTNRIVDPLAVAISAALNVRRSTKEPGD